MRTSLWELKGPKRERWIGIGLVSIMAWAVGSPLWGFGPDSLNGLQWYAIDEDRLVFANPKERWVALVHLDTRTLQRHSLPSLEELGAPATDYGLYPPSPTGRYVPLRVEFKGYAWYGLYVWEPSAERGGFWGNWSCPAWSPSEEWVALVRDEWVIKGGWENPLSFRAKPGQRIMVHGLGSGVQKSLGFLFLLVLHLQWSPDGRKIAVIGQPWGWGMGPRPADLRLYLFDLATDQFVEVDGGMIPPRLIHWSPDSSEIYYMVLTAESAQIEGGMEARWHRAFRVYRLEEEEKHDLAFPESYRGLHCVAAYGGRGGILLRYGYPGEERLLWWNPYARGWEEVLALQYPQGTDWRPFWLGSKIGVRIKEGTSWRIIRPEMVEGALREERLLDAETFARWLEEAKAREEKEGR